jgi:hypothetical protein
MFERIYYSPCNVFYKEGQADRLLFLFVEGTAQKKMKKNFSSLKMGSLNSFS